MLDSKKIMILCKGENKTFNIEKYEFIPECNKIKIFFNGEGDRSFVYNSSNVSILEPQPYSIDGKLIFYEGKAENNIQEVLLFADSHYQFLHVIKKDGTSLCAPKNDFTIKDTLTIAEPANVLSPDGQKIFEYLCAITNISTSEQSSTYTSDDGKSFLSRIYDKLNFIHPESVLFAYLNHHPIRKQEAQLEELIFPFYFNLSQKAALEKALTHSVSIIEGPPGTGKTQTILNILANLTSGLGKTVGVVSFNNEAVKNVKDKLAKQGYDFLIADLGRNEKRKTFFQNLPSIDVAQWEHKENLTKLQNTVKKLNQTLNQLLADDNRRAQLQQEIAAYELEQQHFEQYYSAQQLEDIKKLPFYTQSSQQIVEYLTDVILEEKLQPRLKFMHMLKMLFKYREFRWSKLKTSEMSILLNIQRKFYNLKIQELKKECHSLSKKLEKHSFKTLLAEHQRISEKIFQKKLFISHNG